MIRILIDYADIYFLYDVSLIIFCKSALTKKKHIKEIYILSMTFMYCKDLKLINNCRKEG